MALKDHFVEKAAKGSGSLSAPDSWALQYINVSCARSILEAFDDDASGFVTVNEVNNFTQSRPLGWRCALPLNVRDPFVHSHYSLPYWIAYWAIGNLNYMLRVWGLTFFQVGKWPAQSIVSKSEKLLTL